MSEYLPHIGEFDLILHHTTFLNYVVFVAHIESWQKFIFLLKQEMYAYFIRHTRQQIYIKSKGYIGIVDYRLNPKSLLSDQVKG